MAELTLILAPERFAVCRLSPTAPIPPLPLTASLVSLTLTPDELSIIVPEYAVPEGGRSVGGWRALRVAGTLDFSLTGILASLATPLAKVGVSIFAVSTFDTDYLLVPETELEQALAVLRAAGHEIEE